MQASRARANEPNPPRCPARSSCPRASAWFRCRARCAAATARSSARCPRKFPSVAWRAAPPASWSASKLLHPSSPVRVRALIPGPAPASQGPPRSACARFSLSLSLSHTHTHTHTHTLPFYLSLSLLLSPSLPPSPSLPLFFLSPSPSLCQEATIALNPEP
jgi:hypothetical protein